MRATELGSLNEEGGAGSDAGSEQWLPARIIAGLIQGGLLYALYRSAAAHDALAQQPRLFVPLLLVALLIPPVVIIGISQLRGRRLLGWCLALTAIVALIGYHDAWRQLDTMTQAATGGGAGAHFPSMRAVLAAEFLVFVGYALIAAGETTGRLFAPYPAYFRLSWKLCLQLHLASLFAGTLYLVLWAGAALFMLLKMDFLQRLLGQASFNIPVLAMAFAAGLHITDVRDAFIRGVRTLVLTLLSWILPLLTLIVAAFLLTVAFKGLAPLWATRHAATLMLAVAALLVVLVNAVYKSGPDDAAVPGTLAVTSRAACLLLAPLVAIAAYGLVLRTQQYGLSERRVFAFAAVVVAACYAVGYAWAALARGGSLRRMAPTNVAVALVMLAVAGALFTPVADPARLSVDSQVARLLSGKTPADKFDFQYLRFRAAAYGREALVRLQQATNAPQADLIRQKSAEIAKAMVPTGRPDSRPPDAAAIAANIDVRTRDAALPQSFVTSDWSHADHRYLLPACLVSRTARCDAFLLDLSGDPAPNIVLLPVAPSAASPMTEQTASVFGQDASGAWQLVATFHAGPECNGVRAALAQGTYRLRPSGWQDIEVDGQRIHVSPTRQPEPSKLPCKP